MVSRPKREIDKSGVTPAILRFSAKSVDEWWSRIEIVNKYIFTREKGARTRGVGRFMPVAEKVSLHRPDGFYGVSGVSIK